MEYSSLLNRTTSVSGVASVVHAFPAQLCDRLYRLCLWVGIDVFTEEIAEMKNG
jgi:hypothetical protein